MFDFTNEKTVLCYQWMNMSKSQYYIVTHLEKKMKLAGCYTALITPFRNGLVDYEALTRLLQSQIDAGVAGVVPVGTTGESPTLSMEEHDKVIAFVINFAKANARLLREQAETPLRKPFTSPNTPPKWGQMPRCR